MEVVSPLGFAAESRRCTGSTTALPPITVSRTPKYGKLAGMSASSLLVSTDLPWSPLVSLVHVALPHCICNFFVLLFKRFDFILTLNLPLVPACFQAFNNLFVNVLVPCITPQLTLNSVIAPQLQKQPCCAVTSHLLFSTISSHSRHGYDVVKLRTRVETRLDTRVSNPG